MTSIPEWLAPNGRCHSADSGEDFVYLGEGQFAYVEKGETVDTFHVSETEPGWLEALRPGMHGSISNNPV